MRKLKNKKALIIAGISVAVLAIAGTIAYYSDSMFLRNLFHLANDVSEFTETFVTPNNWTPCTETPKTAIATNKNSTKRYVRMKINEYWRTTNSGTPESDHETTDLPLTWTENGNEEHYAIINTQNGDKWALRDDGWYYYNVALEQDESTLSLLKSVTFNCKVNTVGEIQYGANGKTGISNPNEYGGAKYHLYITFQMSGEEWPDPEGQPHVADCNSNILYDTIACKSKGPDTDVDFSEVAQTAVFSGGSTTNVIDNGFGVVTRANTASDSYPVHYFRGDQDDGHVIWHNYCWIAFRTTGTGGVKLLYDGVPTNGKCPNYDGMNVIEYNGVSTFAYSAVDNGSDSPADVGYMYGARVTTGQVSTESMKQYIFANDITRNGDSYSLSYDSISGWWSQKRTTAATRYHYFCSNGERTCSGSRIKYIIHFGNNYYPYVISMDGYNNIDDLMAAMKTNTNDSNAKTVTEAWFETTGLASHENELEDVVYCNDRHFIDGPLASKDNDATSSANSATKTSRRNSWNNASGVHPSFECDKDDSFTKNDTVNGNGKLKYMVGHITSDELTLSGLVMGGDGSSSLLQSNRRYYTMSPNTIGTSGSMVANIYQGNLHYQGGAGLGSSQGVGLRPVVSLKKGAHYSRGDGTKANPWVIQQ